MKVEKTAGIIPEDTTITTGNPVFLDVRKPPFKVYGLCDFFRRIPDDIAKATSPEVERYAKMTAGARLRFRTDSDYIVIHAGISERQAISQMPAVSYEGFDVYIYDGARFKFAGIFAPSQGDGKNYVESRLRFPTGMKEVMIHFPLFASLENVSVALREGCELLPGSDYTYYKPVIFYGSSIVHGVGSSRPGNAYPAIISRKLGCDFISLGLSGAAKAEVPIMDYISGLDMSVFVYDYDHNAPDAAYLEATHYPGYKRIRAAQPYTPVIMASKPDYYADVIANEKRRLIIENSFKRGIAEGDNMLWFVDGSKMYDPEYLDESTTDNCHPNDMGYVYMAKSIGKAVKEALEKNKRG